MREQVATIEATTKRKQPEVSRCVCVYITRHSTKGLRCVPRPQMLLMRSPGIRSHKFDHTPSLRATIQYGTYERAMIPLWLQPNPHLLTSPSPSAGRVRSTDLRVYRNPPVLPSSSLARAARLTGSFPPPSRLTKLGALHTQGQPIALVMAVRDGQSLR